MDERRRLEQIRRDRDRLRQAEQLQDRADKLARKRQQDREWRSRPTNIKMSRFVWLVIFGLIAIAYFSGNSTGGSSAADTNATTAEAPPDPAASSENAAPPAPSAQSAEAIKPTQANDQDAAAGDSSSKAPPETARDAASDSQVVDDQQKAATAAFSSGRAERWKSGDAAGYAVPSELVAGCRNITISIDADATASRVLKQCS